MMRTPSIGRRFVIAGVGVVAALAIALDLLLFFSLRTSIAQNADAQFEAQATVVKAQAATLGPEALAERLGDIGIDAIVITPEGTRLRSQPADAITAHGPGHVSREVVLGDGTRVLLPTPSPASDPRLGRLLVLEALVTPLVIALGAVLLGWIAEIALKPLDEIARRARLTTLGRRGERLQPDRPHTRLGQMATAYDDMLDSLEGAVAEAGAARAESDRLERRTRKILDSAHEAFVVMDAAGAIIDWNPEAERMFGWSRDEVLGRSWEETLIPEDVRGRLAADRAIDLPASGDAGRGAHLWPYGTRAAELDGVRRDGTRFPAEVTVWATNHDGVCTFNAFVRDLTERRRAEEATTHLAAIVESSDRAILSTDLDGTVLTWNPGAERMYGYRAGEAVGRNLRDLIVPDDYVERLDQALAVAARGEVIQRAELVRRRKDGSLLPVSLTIAPLLDSKGRIYGACSVAQDMTEERRIAEQLDASVVALAAAADEARQSEARTRRFLDDAAHQLRSPITSIRACAETLARDVTPTQRARLLEAVCRESERAGRLMAGLLRMARLGHEQALELQPTDVLALCQEVVDRAALESPHLDITATAVAPPLPQAGLAAGPVTEILSNLVDNARRHARSRIHVSVQAADHGVELRVTDDGAGVPEDQVEVVFERFVSLDARGGSGLGLAIARELARAHGGDLTYEGGAFVLRLPCELVDGGEAPELEAPATVATPAPSLTRSAGR